MNLEKPEYLDYLNKLESVSGIGIDSFKDLKLALQNRMEYFKKRNCKVSDHALDYIMYEPASDEEIETIFTKRLENKELTQKRSFSLKQPLCYLFQKNIIRMIGYYNFIMVRKGIIIPRIQKP